MLSCAVTAISQCSAYAAENASTDGETFFENKIRPVLVARCYECHAGDATEGGLRLDGRGHMLKGGRSGKVVLPGDPAGSLLIRAVRRLDPELKMPPSNEAQLTPEEIANFTAWIKLGAPLPSAAADDGPAKDDGAATADRIRDAAAKLWSLQPLALGDPPADAKSAGGGNEIDQFVRRQLAAAGMQPAPAADKRTLLRRVTYDLTGPAADSRRRRRLCCRFIA